jgi:ABC-2 type transport system permease protein
VSDRPVAATGPPTGPPPPPSPDARILDRGYRAYDGPRRGPSGAVRSVAWSSVLRALGLRRTFWAKVFPLLAVGIAYVPAIVFVGVIALVPARVAREIDLLPSYAGYYGFITAAIVVFTALVAPEVLCPDRRTGMLGLYLASPLSRDTYLLAKTLAVLPVLGLVTLGPPLLLLVGLTFQGAGPDGPVAFATLLGRMVLAALAVSAAYTAVSMAAASLTDRRAVASAGVILLLLVSGAATAVLVELGAPDAVRLLNLMVVPFELVQRIYGGTGDAFQLSTASIVLANLAWTGGAALVVRERYRRMTVTR